MTDDFPRPGDDQGEQVIRDDGDLLANLISQLQRNWDRDDNAANDDLVVRIREHMRSQRDAAAPPRWDTTPALDVECPTGWDEDTTAGRRLPEHPQAVADDLGYWSGHGVQVVSIRSRIDGSGAVIGVHRLTNHIITAMQQRYAFPVHCWDAPSPS